MLVQRLPPRYQTGQGQFGRGTPAGGPSGPPFALLALMGATGPAAATLLPNALQTVCLRRGMPPYFVVATPPTWCDRCVVSTIRRSGTSHPFGVRALASNARMVT